MDKRVYGLDLPDEITKENEKITKAMLGITEDDINSIEIDDDDDDEQGN